MSIDSEKEDSQQYRLRQVEKPSRLDKPDNDRGDRKGKSLASGIFLVTGIIILIMGLLVLEWVGEQGSQNPVVAAVFFLVALPLLAIGAFSIFSSTYSKTMSSLATPEEKDQRADSNDETGTENAQNTSRGGRRFFKWFFVIVQLGVLALLIKFAIALHLPILLFIFVIAAGALIWRALKWERNERKIH
jgi:Flp pilus assembly protein TadB